MHLSFQPLNTVCYLGFPCTYLVSIVSDLVSIVSDLVSIVSDLVSIVSDLVSIVSAIGANRRTEQADFFVYFFVMIKMM